MCSTLRGVYEAGEVMVLSSERGAALRPWWPRAIAIVEQRYYGRRRTVAERAGAECQ